MVRRDDESVLKHAAYRLALGAGPNRLGKTLALVRWWCRASPPPNEPVEASAVAALHALLQLGVDVEGHLGVGVADLAHDPLDVEVVREQCD